MSSEEADKKSEEETKEIESSTEESDAKNDTAEEKVNGKPATKKKAAEPTKIKQPAKKRMKTEQVEKESKKAEKKKASKEKVEEEEEEDEEENQKAVPLLDQPLEVTGSRQRKEVQRFAQKENEGAKKEMLVEVGKGKGVALGKMEVVKHGISRARPEALKLLHRLCFNKVGNQGTLKENLLKFNGWEYEEGSDDFEKKKEYARGIKKVVVSQLKDICIALDIEKTGSKDDLLDRILSYLVCPVDSGKKLAPGRSKRKGALSKNYNEGDETYDDTKKKGKQKKKSEEESAGSDYEEDMDKKEEEVKQTNKKKVNKNTEESKPEEKGEKEEENKEEEEDEKEEEDKKPVKKGGKKGKKAAAPVKKVPPKKRAAAKKTTKTDSEDAADGDDESDNDESEAKKAKTPPTDEEIRTYVKSLLDGANLELITMKKVCQDVYDHYPEFNLANRKEFIKTTVKALISS